MARVAHTPLMALVYAIFALDNTPDPVPASSADAPDWDGFAPQEATEKDGSAVFELGSALRRFVFRAEEHPRSIRVANSSAHHATVVKELAALLLKLGQFPAGDYKTPWVQRLLELRCVEGYSLESVLIKSEYWTDLLNAYWAQVSDQLLGMSSPQAQQIESLTIRAASDGAAIVVRYKGEKSATHLRVPQELRYSLYKHTLAQQGERGSSLVDVAVVLERARVEVLTRLLSSR